MGCIIGGYDEEETQEFYVAVAEKKAAAAMKARIVAWYREQAKVCRAMAGQFKSDETNEAMLHKAQSHEQDANEIERLPA